MRFLVNDRVVETDAWAGSPALDFIRKDLGLTGSKEGCREGDCGACAVLVGDRAAGRRGYLALPSCLLALGELDGKHLVTIEGLSSASPDGITPVMQAILAENGSQCGFCSPGFVISLTAFLLGELPLSLEGAERAVEGNLCRCTGYGAIRRAAERLIARFGELPQELSARIALLEAAAVLPASMGAFLRGELLDPLSAVHGVAAHGVANPSGPAQASHAPAELRLGGGTDYFVRNPDPEVIRTGSGGSFPPLRLLDLDPGLRGVRSMERNGSSWLELGAALTWTDFFADASLRAAIPGIERFESSVASILIRNRATLGGNVVNASPVADLTSMLIALGAECRIEGGGSARTVPLESIFLAYKRLDLKPGEFISAFLLPAGGGGLRFNFEKAAKRAHLDIAAVNSACAFRVRGGRIESCRLSAGGVAALPLFLKKSSAFIEGKPVSPDLAREAAAMAASEVSPIGDVRGSAGYRRRVLERLVFAHFVVCFPEARLEEVPLP
ncbi:MAG TPA: FAD binding domain-containing protein [Rectinemataceae bacterium]|nr:FAD binding domain-containing protein [Rectinemataceae bacterium]